MNLPNKLTILRLILIPIFTAIFFINAIPFNYIISALIFALAAFTDYLDGHIARKYNLVTDLGKFLDPIADKVLVSTALIIMLVGANGSAILPWYSAIGVAIILARELIISGFRMVAASKSIVIAADYSGKIKTTVQDISILVLLCGIEFIEKTNVIFLIGFVAFWISVALTIVSGIECFVKNKSVIKSK